MAPFNPESRPSKAIWTIMKNVAIARRISLALKIVLPIADMATDIYTTARFYDSKKSYMQRVFYASFFAILLHNLVSGIHGVHRISRMNKEGPVAVWSGKKWKMVTLLLYAMGLGSIVVPIEVAKMASDTDPNRYSG